jgi:methylenetetrahydrofolate reductase (NADPH)
MYSTLQRRLAAGQVVVTGEIAPPKGAGRAGLEKLADNLRNVVDAVNVTDNQRGVARMSSLGAGVVLQQAGAEPIVQISCQHRNRIALQADVLSGSALGIRNFLCMTGDHPKIGDHPTAKNVLDLNSFHLLEMLRKMRDEHTFQSGTPLKNPPTFFLGAVSNPNIEKVTRIAKKVEFGAEFIQTQMIFDVERFRTWMADVRSEGLHKQAHIIAGIMLVRSAKGVAYLRDSLPGTVLPDSVLERMERAEDPEAEGISLAAELSQELLSIEGVAGIHLMSVGWSKAMPQVVERAGLLARPPVPELEG